MDSQPIQVLLLTEKPNQANVMEKMLKDSQEKWFTVAKSENFFDAFDKLAEKHFDILLMELGVKNQENLRFLKKIHVQFPDIPILIISSRFEEDVALKSLEYGALDYLIKGEFYGKILERSIQNAIKRKEIQLKLREKAEKIVDNAPLNVKGISEDFADVLHELQVNRIELEMQNQELRKTWLELEGSRKKYQDLYDFAPVGYLSMDEKGVILNTNLTSAMILNVDRSNLINKAFILFLDNDSRRKFHKHLKNVSNTGTNQSCELKITKNGGESFEALLETLPVPDEEGNLIEFRTSLSDITERKNAEISVARLAALVKSSDDAIVGMDLDGYILSWNSGAQKIFGYAADEMVGKTIEHLLPPVQVEKMKDILKMVKNGETVKNYETMRIKKNKQEITVSLTVSPIFNNTGEIIGASSIARDISENKKVLNALLDSDERFKQVAESADEWIWEVDTDGLYIYSSPVVENILGYRVDEVVGKMHFYDFYLPETRDKLKKEAFKIFKDKRKFKNYLNKNLHKNGTEVILETSGVPILDKQGNLTGYRGADNDITIRKQAEEALKKSEKELQDIINHLPDATFAINDEGKIISWNKALEDLVGVKAADIIGKGNYEYAIPFYGVRRPILIDLIFKSDDDFIKNHYFNIKKDKHALTAETMIPDFHGGELFLWGKASPLYDESEKLVGAIESIRDITDMKKTEGELQVYRENLEKQVEGRTIELAKTNERLKTMIAKHEKTEIKLAELIKELERSNEELEQFAYVASHDLQEPLRMVSSFTQLLERQYKDKLDENAHEYIKYAVDGAKRMQKLINDLLAYSRVTTRGESFTQIDAKEIVNQVLFNLEIAIEENDAQVVVDPLPKIYADPSQMNQLFQNLIGNAIKYRSKEAPHIHISAQKGEDEWIFQVSDNGIGISPEYYQRIFQIFQRLHEMHVYTGTGVGLAICKKIVERHGGRIWLESEVGKGSKFYFSIAR